MELIQKPELFILKAEKTAKPETAKPGKMANYFGNDATAK